MIKKRGYSVGKFFMGGIMGYGFFWLTTHPTRSPIRKAKSRSIHGVSYFPNIKIKRKDKEYWLHHWINLSALYLILFLTKNKLIKSKVTNGFLLGSILQGLSYKDRFRVVNAAASLVPQEDDEK